MPNIKRKDNLVILKLKGKDQNLNELYKLKEKVKTVYVKGIKGVTLSYFLLNFGILIFFSPRRY